MCVCSRANLSYERSGIFVSAYCSMVSCFAWSYHCRHSIHIVLYVFLRRCVSVCSLSKFVTSGWIPYLAVSVLAYTGRNSRKCCSAVSVTWENR